MPQVLPPDPDDAPRSLVLSPGLATLVRALMALPSPPRHDLALVGRLAPLPSRVLSLVASEILDAANRGEITARPSFGEVRRMALAAMAAQHRLFAVRDECRRRG